MFDFAWSEIALIGVVALIAIGPKDMPVAIKAVAEMIKKARRMAGEFQTHVDEMVREADLHEVRDQFNDLRRMDIKGKILSAVDDDGSLRRTLSENPMDFSPKPPVVPVPDTVPDTVPDSAPGAGSEWAPDFGPGIAVTEHAPHAIAAPDAAPEAPSFVPPAFVPPAIAALPPREPPPAFVPPAFVSPASAAAQTQHA